MKKNQYLNRYQCSSCPKWFSERRYLTNHLKTHEVNEYIEAFHNKPKRNSEQIVQISDSQSILMELNKLYDEHENFMSKRIKIASESNSNNNDVNSTAGSSMKSNFSELDNEQEDWKV
ncbi:MAG TPA: C2H2-type zinc finger protein [Verrucomicrobiae bacterium]|nr:C2H2-type zinc finger protein [Verrucomicrobiae bacterium]